MIFYLKHVIVLVDYEKKGGIMFYIAYREDVESPWQLFVTSGELKCWPNKETLMPDLSKTVEVYGCINVMVLTEVRFRSETKIYFSS